MASYSLREPLPPEVFRRTSSGIARYRNYPVFSWGWSWRRTVIFGSLAGLYGVAQGVSLGLQVQNVELGIRAAVGGAIGFGLFFGAGPLLASLVRHARLSARTEGIGIAAAICVGVAVSLGVQGYADERSRIRAEQGTSGQARPRPEPGPLAFRYASFVVGFFITNGGLALRAYASEQRRWREHEHEREVADLRGQRDASDRRLAVLQAQVEPHFLFNTLASLRSLIKSDPRRAEATLDALVDHLRATLPRLRPETGEVLSTLAEQVEVCRSYLALMQIRMGERLSIEIDVPHALHSSPFPPLLLISLVENAIKHGVERKPGPCTVRIAAQRLHCADSDCLSVRVEDDGAGLEVGLGAGVGLANVRAQLAERHGSRGSLSLESRPAGGVIASVIVPLEESCS